MQRVNGIGGIFFKARDAERLREWYREHLGLPVASWGGVSFDGRDARPGERQTSTIWSVLAGDTRYFEPSTSPFMINYRVNNLDGLLTRLRAAGVTVEGKVVEDFNGKFGWVMDPEGNKIELWEPKPGY